ncbi:phosphatidylethanolamine-binding protein [Pseudomassariella vexata]|uniref:Phosphatidylethanolamine-binding protein n=1 Tax=Pseudomassariella vexata TaxID=1141098 RepID=A0A1Y2DTQ9_9PEZI|nr:phosphatidylethanolamine-binding protein [Pseudomassariella vexata]ORY62534.1 phosphatidylethanolamine-binding protein [Pseudomassariella vexata]
MIAIKLITFSLLLGSALAAQSTTTSPGFTPASDTLLGLFFDGNTFVASGSHKELSQVSIPPKLALEKRTHATNYLSLMVDPDVFYLNVTYTFLHWLSQDLAIGDHSSFPRFPFILTNTSANLAEYISPGPQAGDTHRYVYLLFNQPKGFNITDAPYDTDVYTRLSFNLPSFIQENGLGDPVAGNYFLATNTSSK